MLRRAIALSVFLVSWAGCANGGGRPDTGSGSLDASSRDGGALDASTDGGAIDGGAIDGGRDGGAIDGGGRDAPDAGGSIGDLDPRLDVPPASNTPCDGPGSLSECPGIAVCRFYSSSEGRCESCTECGNLFAPCAGGEDCDILFVCFEGRCTNFCTLGTTECGAPGDCIDVGHPSRGACRPDA